MSVFASLQEEIIHKLSQNIFGPQLLFKPDHYMKNGNSKEPADLVWISNRCAVLMYMTKSVKSFERKVDHNLKQLKKWISHWKNGYLLKGSINSNHHSIKFSDVDHIIGISIIEDGEVFCKYHSDRVIDLHESKLSVCATISAKVIRLLAGIGAGPREIIAALAQLHSSNADAPIEEASMLQMILDSQAAQLTLVSDSLEHDILTSAHIQNFGSNYYILLG